MTLSNGYGETKSRYPRNGLKNLQYKLLHITRLHEQDVCVENTRINTLNEVCSQPHRQESKKLNAKNNILSNVFKPENQIIRGKNGRTV